MPAPARLPLALALAVALPAGAAALAWACFGFDFGLPDVARITREGERGERLDRENRSSLERSTGKRRVTAEVLRGRLTLTQAGDAFRRLHEAHPEADDRDMSDEGLCESVLLWVRSELPAGPEGEALLRGLEEEFVTRFGRRP